MSVNVWGMAALTRAFLPLLRCCAADVGVVTPRVVNIASVAGRVAMGGTSAYSMSKHAVEAFSDSLRREVKCFGVDVITIEPGFFKTNIIDPVKQTEAARALFLSAPAATQEAYGRPFFEMQVAEFAKLVGILQDTRPEKVAGVLLDAVTMVRPPAHNLVGMDAHLFFAPAALLPAFVADPILTDGMFPSLPHAAVANPF